MPKTWRDWLKYLIPFAAAVLVFAIITDSTKFFAFFGSVFEFLTYILSKFIIAIVLAFILNFIVRFVRRRLKWPNWIAVVIAFIVFFGFIALLTFYIIPLMFDSIYNQILPNLGNYIDAVTNFINNFLRDLHITGANMEEVEFSLASLSTQLFETIGGIFNVDAISNIVSSSTRIIMDVFFGLIISVYMLIDKDKLVRGMKRLVYALFKVERATRINAFLRNANRIFSKFIIGRVLESFIMAVLSGILYALFGLPLVPFMMTVTFLFGIIPTFGPIISGIITEIVLLCYDPFYALYGLIVVVLVMALDGWIIGPMILGDATGISPLLTICTLAIAADLGGFLGIFLGVPVVAAVKTLVVDSWIRRRIQRKGLEERFYPPPPNIKKKPGLSARLRHRLHMGDTTVIDEESDTQVSIWDEHVRAEADSERGVPSKDTPDSSQ